MKPSKTDNLWYSNRAFVKDICRISWIYISVYAILMAFFVWAPALELHTRAKILGFLSLAGTAVGGFAFWQVSKRAPADGIRNQRFLATTLILASSISLNFVHSYRSLSEAGIIKNSLPVLHHGWAWGAGLVCLGLSAILVPRPSIAKNSHLRIALDSLVLSAGATTIGWYVLVQPLLLSIGSKSDVASVTFWRVTLDLVLASQMLLLVNHGMGRENRGGIRLLVLAMCAFLANDVIRFLHYGEFLDFTPTYLEILPPVANLILILAAIVVRFGPISSSKNQWVIPTIFQQALPYLCVPAVYLVVTNSVLHSRDPMVIMGTIVGCGATISLLLLRQVVAFQENRELLVNLSDAYARLEEQACQIEAKNGELLALNMELDSALKIVEESNRSLSNLATSDGLTGLPNQRAFQTRLKEEVARTQRSEGVLSLAMIDVDHFKSYNDNFGHPAGDDVLKQVAMALRAAIREEDFLARYGGEEFVCIFPDSTEEESREVCERIRQSIANLNPKFRKVSVSVGVASWAPQDGQIQELLEHADFSLYGAKKRGRNRVISYSQLPPEISQVPQELLEKADHDRAVLGSVQLAIEVATSFDRNLLLGDRDRRNLEGMIASLELRDVETEGHTERVMWMSLRLALQMICDGKIQYDRGFFREVTLGALLHDIGKIGISDQILHKPGKLNDHEYTLMKRHTLLGVRFLERFPHLSDALPVVQSHHECWNGKGYPDGLSAEEIPLSARIFSLCDSFDAMVSHRAYQSARALDFALAEIRDLAGQQFDPQIVDSFFKVPVDDWKKIGNAEVYWIVELSQILSKQFERAA